MGAKAIDAYRRDILSKEYLRLSSAIQAQEAQSDKILNIGVTLVSFSAAVGISQRVHLIFFLIPLAVIMIALYTLMTYYYIQSLAGYKRHIEQLINAELGEQILTWETIVRDRERKNVVRPTLLCAYTVIATGLIAISLTYVYETYGCLSLILLSVVALAFAPFIFLSGRELLRENDATHQYAVRLHAPPNIPVTTTPSLVPPPVQDDTG